MLVEEEEEEDTQWRENRLEGTGPSEQVGETVGSLTFVKCYSFHFFYSHQTPKDLKERQLHKIALQEDDFTLQTY